MNISSDKRIAAGLAAAVALALGGCLPGPWDYAPEKRPVFRGITVMGYAVADRPVEHLCFEKLLALEEASTDAFPFYDDDSVSVTGNFLGGGPVVILTPHPNTPNCFTGPPGALFRRGEDYLLRARFAWDSAGVPAVTVLTATARVPAEFGIADTAYAPGLAGPGVALDGITDPDVFLRLPQPARDFFVSRYGDTLTALDGDAAGLAIWKASNEAAMKENLTLFLLSNGMTYRRGDSLFYLSAVNNLGNLSHFFKARRAASVKGVLIVHRFDTTASRPVTPFDSIFGIAPDSASFYFPGDHSRLIFYGDYRNPDGRHIFDSLGVVNAWFWSGRNRLYFYGTEKIYSDFQVAREEAAGNSKIRLPTNVTGGRGFFAGMVLDSFDVHIKLDSATQAFPYALTRAAACRDKGWHNTRDCVGYYPEYCAANGWAPPDCRLDAIHVCVDSAFRAANPGVCGVADAAAAADAFLAIEALTRYCIERNYPADFPGCADVRAECENSNAGNGCQLVLWKHCQLNYWKPPECAEGMKSYCRARRDVQRVMCRDVAD